MHFNRSLRIFWNAHMELNTIYTWKAHLHNQKVWCMKSFTIVFAVPCSHKISFNANYIILHVITFSGSIKLITLTTKFFLSKSFCGYSRSVHALKNPKRAFTHPYSLFYYTIPLETYEEGWDLLEQGVTIFTVN